MGALESLAADAMGPDPIPAAIRNRLQLMEKLKAFWQAHWPEPAVSLDDLARDAFEMWEVMQPIVAFTRDSG